MKNQMYADVIGMDGGTDAVAEFGPISYKAIEKQK